VIPETSWPRTAEDLGKATNIIGRGIVVELIEAAGTSPVDPDGYAEPVRPTGRGPSY
jgi:hypothetical protein